MLANFLLLCTDVNLVIDAQLKQNKQMIKQVLTRRKRQCYMATSTVGNSWLLCPRQRSFGTKLSLRAKARRCLVVDRSIAANGTLRPTFELAYVKALYITCIRISAWTVVAQLG